MELAPINKRCGGCPDAKGTYTRVKKEPEPPSFKGARKMEDGSILFSKGPDDWEPPPIPDGYERDPENAWRFISKWVPCSARIQTPFVKPCGAVRILTICNNSACELRREEVTSEQCAGCEHRKN